MPGRPKNTSHSIGPVLSAARELAGGRYLPLPVPRHPLAGCCACPHTRTRLPPARRPPQPRLLSRPLASVAPAATTRARSAEEPAGSAALPAGSAAPPGGSLAPFPSPEATPPPVKPPSWWSSGPKPRWLFRGPEL